MTSMHWSFIKNNDSVKLIKDMLSETEFNLITSIPWFPPRCLSDNIFRILFTLACRCSSPTSVSIFDRIHSTFIYKIIFQLHPLHMPQNECTKQFFRCCRGKWRSWVENENCRWHKYCNIYKAGHFGWEVIQGNFWFCKCSVEKIIAESLSDVLVKTIYTESVNQLRLACYCCQSWAHAPITTLCQDFVPRNDIDLTLNQKLKST